MLTSLLPALPAPSPRQMGHILATVSLLRQESNKALVSGGCTSHLGLTSLLLPFSSPPEFDTHHHPLLSLSADPPQTTTATTRLPGQAFPGFVP